jgi:glutamate:Na+ symporter, ESS family
VGFETIEGVFTINLDLISTTTLAGVLLLLGYFIRNKVPILDKFCFPAPVIGGFLFALLTLILHTTDSLAFSLDTTLQTPFMLAFFTTIGLGGSFKLIKTGGKSLIIYLVICWVIAIIQNTVGVSLAMLLDINPLLGIMAGAASLEGGHGTAATFGPVVESLGVDGATVVGIAAATFGLISGSLTGGPLAKWLITKNKLEIKSNDSKVVGYDELVEKEHQNEKVNSREFVFLMTIIGILMMFGLSISSWVDSLGITNFFLPAYVGAMFTAIIFRNTNDKVGIVKINGKVVDIISNVSIDFFLTMAMMSLKIWQLADLALPLIIILFVQVIIILLIAVFVLFPLLGKDYDAAVIVSGLMGHALGATPNAVANMGSVCDHYKVRATKAFLIVPICGAVLIDIVSIPCITIFITIFSKY